VTNFGNELRRLLGERGMSLREAARRAHCDPGYLSKVANGHKSATPNMIAILEKVLSANGALTKAAEAAALTNPRSRATRVATRTDVEVGRRVVQALETIDDGRITSVVDGLAALIEYYAETICVLPPMGVYDEILTVRSYANKLTERSGFATRHRDLALTAGWLSALLAIAACDMGEHGAARVWCSDAERRSQEAKHPELAGWAILTRAMIAFYQGRPRQSATLSARGQEVASIGTVIHAKLAAQEMRAAAMIGDVSHMTQARNFAARAIARLPAGAKVTGAFSITLGEDPPYTATSLLLVGRFNEAVLATNRVIQTAYHADMRRRSENPSGYARSLLILGLAQAGARHLDEAVTAGQTALNSSRPAWPTMVLAGRLDQVLARDFTGTRQTAAYHVRYLEMASHQVKNHL
jgi:transcriptional regulator with XRE-family HTH domain